MCTLFLKMCIMLLSFGLSVSFVLLAGLASLWGSQSVSLCLSLHHFSWIQCLTRLQEVFHQRWLVPVPVTVKLIEQQPIAISLVKELKLLALLLTGL